MRTIPEDSPEDGLFLEITMIEVDKREEIREDVVAKRVVDVVAKRVVDVVVQRDLLLERFRSPRTVEDICFVC